MTDGQVLPPGSGQRIGAAGMTLKVGAEQSENWSIFETDVGPGFDVGAHLHHEAEELFYLLEGELDLLAFEPRVRTIGAGSWRTWESESGARVVRGGPGTVMYVPRGCPHAFHNPGSTPARMFFQTAPSGHEHYLAELAEMFASGLRDMGEIAKLRERHDIHELTPMSRLAPGP